MEKIPNRDTAGITREKELKQKETGAENAEDISRATSPQETPTPPGSELVEEEEEKDEDDEDDEGEKEEEENDEVREHSPRATTCNPMGFVKRNAKRNAKKGAECESDEEQLGEQPDLLADATMADAGGVKRSGGDEYVRDKPSKRRGATEEDSPQKEKSQLVRISGGGGGVDGRAKRTIGGGGSGGGRGKRTKVAGPQREAFLLLARATGGRHGVMKPPLPPPPSPSSNLTPISTSPSPREWISDPPDHANGTTAATAVEMEYGGASIRSIGDDIDSLIGSSHPS